LNRRDTREQLSAALRRAAPEPTAGAPHRNLPYHRAILDEIRAHNPDGARRTMHRLMDLTERNILPALTRRKSTDAPSPDTAATGALRLLVCWRNVRIDAGVGGVG